jgi:hypothetical protein
MPALNTQLSIQNGREYSWKTFPLFLSASHTRCPVPSQMRSLKTIKNQVLSSLGFATIVLVIKDDTALFFVSVMVGAWNLLTSTQ